MLQNRLKIQRLTLIAFFSAIECILAFTPIGYIPIGPLNITTMHIPVILASIVLGWKEGTWMGFVFGMTSFIRHTFMPGITSFVFSPFITVSNISGNFSSVLICFVPRIMLGGLPGILFALFKKHMPGSIAAGISAAFATLIHTVAVLGGIYIFFASDYAEALHVSIGGVVTILLGVVSSNMVLEILFALIVIPMLVRALQPMMKKMGLQ